MKILLLALVSLFLLSCEQGVRYEYTLKRVVPDSLREKQQLFVTETVRAASYHMTGGDYEDPEDIIRQADQTFTDIYGVPTEGLNLVNETWVQAFIKFPEMDTTQRKIFYSLREQHYKEAQNH